MAEEPKEAYEEPAGAAAPEPPAVEVGPSPHIASGALTTHRMMVDVLIALVPVMVAAGWIFGWYALKQAGVCVVSCVAAEMLFNVLRGRCPMVVLDGSAVVTGMILALSLPWSAPWYVGVIASAAAIGLGKFVFGGLGQNIFNPAMVGRAFVMICFAQALGATAYVGNVSDVVSQATPMTALKAGGPIPAAPQWLARLLPAWMLQSKWMPWSLLIGNTNGSLGETSAIACLIGGLYLCIRRTASWEIPAGALAAVALIGGAINVFLPQAGMTVTQHLLGGALLFGAFYIATDPVSSPLTPKGKWIFGAGVGAMVMLLRTCSGYPEGVMFAVLLMNALVPLINRWTIPTPVGGPVPARK